MDLSGLIALSAAIMHSALRDVHVYRVVPRVNTKLKQKLDLNECLGFQCTGSTLS